MPENCGYAGSPGPADNPLEPAVTTAELRLGVPADPEADERLRADLAAIKEAEREAHRQYVRIYGDPEWWHDY